MKFRFFLFILLSIANAFASDLDFTLVNQTARSFEGLYITASDNKDWDANLLLDGKVLAAGGKTQVRFKSDAISEAWDFNLVDDEGLSVTFDKVKLAGVDTVTLKDVNGKITAEIEKVANLLLVFWGVLAHRTRENFRRAVIHSMLEKIIRDFMTIWTMIDPISNLALFSGLTAASHRTERRRIPWRASLYAAIVLVVAVVIGQILLDAMVIRLRSLQIAGGFIRFIFGLQMLFG